MRHGVGGKIATDNFPFRMLCEPSIGELINQDRGLPVTLVQTAFNFQ
jgi:hypothetical protein